MKLNIFDTEEELLTAITLYFIEKANQFIQEKNIFNVSLAGGNSPKKLYQLLSSEKYKNKIEWNKVNFFFGDERYVPADNKERNSLMVQQYLFDPLKISPSQIFAVNTSLPPDQSAENYNKVIVSFFKNSKISFDLTLLGLGDNSHTASLFPHTSVLKETAATVKSVFLEKENIYRITMTAQMINQSKNIAFLVFGKQKAEAVHHILKDKYDPEKYPAQLIKPVDGELQWFLDICAMSSTSV